MNTESDCLGVKSMDISYSEKEVKGKVLGLERRGGFPASSPRGRASEDHSIREPTSTKTTITISQLGA